MLDRTLSFAALCDEARKALYPGLPPAEQPLVRRFTFRDHEGDMIAIMNDMQLKNAVSSTPSDTLPNLNARARVCTTCAQSAHTSRRHCNPTVTNFCCTQILSFKFLKDEQARYLELKAADTTSGPMPAASASVQELDDEEEPAAD